MHLYLDIVTLVVAVVLAILGAISGFIREIFRLAGMIGGVVVAFLFYNDLGSVIASKSPTPNAAADIMAFLIIFVAVFLVIIGIGFLLRKFTDLITLGWVDRLLGALFGVSKVLIIVWAVCVSISSSPVQEAKFKDSVVYSTFKSPWLEALHLENLEAARDVLRGVSKAVDKNTVIQINDPADTPSKQDNAEETSDDSANVGEVL